MFLPRAPSQIAKTCAQPRATPRDRVDGPYRDRCQNGYSTKPVSIDGTRMMKFRSCTSPGRNASITIGISGPKKTSSAV